MKKVNLLLLLALFLSCSNNQEIVNPISLETVILERVIEEDECIEEEQEEDESPNHPPEPDPDWSGRLALHREFRDSYLKNSEHSKYIGYYYDYSKEVSYRNIGAVTKIKMLSVIYDVDIAINNLLDNDYNGVIIDSDLASDIINILDDLKALTTNKEPFNEIEAYLILITNKTKEYL